MTEKYRDAPPRMTEPGWGEHVIAGFTRIPRQPWVHVGNRWFTHDGMVTSTWDALIDPEPLNMSEETTQ